MEQQDEKDENKKKPSSSGRYSVTRKGMGGRPSKSKIDPLKHPLVLKWLRAELQKPKVTDLDLALGLGVSLRTFERWKAKNPEFWRDLARPSESELVERVEASLYEKANGFIRHKKKYDINGNVTSIEEIVYPPDVAAQRYILNNRLPERWKEKIEVHGTSEPPPTNFTFQIDEQQKADAIEVDFYESEH